MEYRTFGTTDLNVAPLGLGCMSRSGVYGPADATASLATLHRAFALGINVLDPSARYGNGHNHELIAKAIKGRRATIVLHSKSGSPARAGCQRSAWRQQPGLPDGDLW